MAQYLLLIYEDEAAAAAAGPDALAATLAGHQAFGEANRATVRGGAALEGTGSATSVRRDDGGGFVITDGPFAETKEALGGYYLIDARDLDHALDIAKLCPARFGGVEVRPIMIFS